LLDASSSSPSPDASTSPPDRKVAALRDQTLKPHPTQEVRTDLAALERVDEGAVRSSRQQPL
jgi:hypothetical protein